MGAGINGVNHVASLARNMDETAAFYGDVLEIGIQRIVSDAPNLKHYAFDLGGGGTLDFFEAAPGMTEGARDSIGGLNHLALTTDPAWNGGNYDAQPRAGFNAFARVWAGWGLSQAFYRRRGFEAMGFATVDAFLTDFWEARYHAADANNMLSMLTTWRASDVSNTAAHGGDLTVALGSITAKTLVLPGQTDLYFPPEDNEIETAMIAGAKCRVIPSDYGHSAGGGANPDDVAFLDAALGEFLQAEA